MSDETLTMHTQPVPSPFGPGRRILNRYRVVRELGRGAMGVVYRCHDEVGDIDVAIKAVPPEVTIDPAEMEEIRQNFRLVERLHHPNIANVKTLERDPDSGRYFLVMEFVAGVNLRAHRLARGGNLPPDETLPLLEQIASALDYGHSERIIHRDIKPANVMIGAGGKVKILDYGIASQVRDSLSRVTQVQAPVSGTGPYMAPEQWQGLPQDGRSDQYALAVLAYELLAGRPPFENPELSVLREAVLHETVPMPANLPAAAATALGKALAKGPKDRFATCSEFAAAMLAAFPAGAAAPARRRRAPLLAGVAAIVLAALGVGAWLALKSAAPASSTPNGRSAQPLPAAPATTPAAPAPVPGRLLPRYHALVIGISDYAAHGAEGWDDLGTARGDAEAVAQELEQGYGFQVKRLLDQEATRDAVMVALDELVSLGDDDAALIYYAGHGYFEEKLGEGYWIPSNARRQRGARPAKEDWLWNSTITKILGASPARHILVVADACYGGSLFRGGEVTELSRQLQWYKRAMSAPSRFLITSGDLEPVLDSGARHSIFAQQVLNYLRHPDKELFSASDLGLSVREKVSAMTGQLVRMGQLPVAANAGGEFVFVRKDSPFAAQAAATGREPPGPAASGGRPAEAPALVAATTQQRLQDALLMRNQGAAQSAQQVLAAVQKESADDRLVRLVAAQMDRERRSNHLGELRALIDRLQAQSADGKAGGAGQPTGFARPRIIACIGPAAPPGGSDELESLAMLYRLCLRGELEGQEGLYVVEREALQEILTEMNLGASDLADPRAQLAIGQLLPASLILLGDLLSLPNGQQLYLRLVDTETTKVLSTFSATAGGTAEVAPVCQKLAGDVSAKAIRARPLAAQVLGESNGLLQAGVGRFHGAAMGQSFQLIERQPAGSATVPDHREQVVGQAVIVAMGETTSDLRPEWSADRGGGEIWVRQAF
jgi:predicted Ser/Thr protein kinase